MRRLAGLSDHFGVLTEFRVQKFYPQNAPLHVHDTAAVPARGSNEGVGDDDVGVLWGM